MKKQNKFEMNKKAFEEKAAKMKVLSQVIDEIQDRIESYDKQANRFSGYCVDEWDFFGWNWISDAEQYVSKAEVYEELLEYIYKKYL